MTSIGARLKERHSIATEATFYSHFEPWDVGVRPQWVEEQAKADGIDLYRKEFVKTNNVAPHPFQTGFLLSDKKFRGVIGPSQGGKSLNIFIEIGCMCSGEFPISLQYNKGVDTGVKRMKTEMNVQRWGRRDIHTGAVIDHDTKYPDDGSWDCGTIIGAGKYPQSKVIPRDTTGMKVKRAIWVGTTQKAFMQSWWPGLVGNNALLPQKFLDKTKGNKGVNQADRIVHLVNDIELSIITYEADYSKFEAIQAWACFMDEEPRDQRCVSGAIGHCRYFSLVMTPLHGMTYTKDIFYKGIDKNRVTFQANAYDSPYITTEEIEANRTLYLPHQIGACIWGDHSCSVNQPYYDRNKIRSWLNMIDEEDYYLAEFEADRPFYGTYRRPETKLDGVMDTVVSLVDVTEVGDKRNVWKIYEDRIDGAAYFIMADSANGADLPEDAGDFSSALVMRKPISSKNETLPVFVAELQTTVTPDLFAEYVGLALNYYNFALCCAESSSRGAANGMFYSELKTYKYWYMRLSESQHSRKKLERKGFDMNAGTRKVCFDEVGKWFGLFKEDEYPKIPSEVILVTAGETEKVVKNGTLRPDHPRGKNNDLLVCFGTALWIFKTFPNQIKCNREAPRDNLDPDCRKMVKRILQATGGDRPQAQTGFFPGHKGRMQ